MKTINAIIISIPILSVVVSLIYFSPVEIRVVTIMDILRLFVSWPTVILVVSFAFGATFKQELSIFIRNICNIRFPGGEITMQPPQSNGQIINVAEQPNVSREQLQLIADELTQLSQAAATAENEKQEILDIASNLLAEKDRNTTYWFYKYMSMFLVPNTQSVLRWFLMSPYPPSKEQYNIMWEPIITNARERDIIIMVLIQNNLVQQNANLLCITDLGKNFIRFMDNNQILV